MEFQHISREFIRWLRSTEGTPLDAGVFESFCKRIKAAHPIDHAHSPVLLRTKWNPKALRYDRIVSEWRFPDGTLYVGSLSDGTSSDGADGIRRNVIYILERWVEDQDPHAVTIPADLRELLDQLPPDDTEVNGKQIRTAHRRDHLFRLWNLQQSGFGPVKIADKWNRLPNMIRKIVSPRLSVKVTTGTAKRALVQAKEDLKTAPKKRSRTRS